LIRIWVGGIFVLSGTQKLLEPYQNFLFVIQSYQILIRPWDTAAAFILPWGELILGIFTILGLWTKWALRGLLLLTTAFMAVVAQAIIRDLPIKECGCFGEALSFSLPVTLLLDSVLWVYIAFLIIRLERTSRFSIDGCYLKHEAQK
jgi:hypothetical protein